jgi:hypothetical protein
MGVLDADLQIRVQYPAKLTINPIYTKDQPNLQSDFISKWLADKIYLPAIDDCVVIKLYQYLKLCADSLICRSFQ